MLVFSGELLMTSLGIMVGRSLNLLKPFESKTLEGKPSNLLPNKCFLHAMQHPLSSGV